MSLFYGVMKACPSCGHSTEEENHADHCGFEALDEIFERAAAARANISRSIEAWLMESGVTLENAKQYHLVHHEPDRDGWVLLVLEGPLRSADDIRRPVVSRMRYRITVSTQVKAEMDANPIAAKEFWERYGRELEALATISAVLLARWEAEELAAKLSTGK